MPRLICERGGGENRYNGESVGANNFGCKFFSLLYLVLLPLQNASQRIQRWLAMYGFLFSWSWLNTRPRSYRYFAFAVLKCSIEMSAVMMTVAQIMWCCVLCHRKGIHMHSMFDTENRFGANTRGENPQQWKTMRMYKIVMKVHRWFELG